MITIESYLRSGRTAEEYIQDLEQVGYSISDTTRAQIETWFQQQAAGQVTVPRLGYAFDLPEGLVRHINTPEYQTALQNLQQRIEAALQPFNAPVKLRTIGETGTLELSFDIGEQTVRTGLQPSRYGLESAIDWGTSVAVPTTVMAREAGGRWAQREELTPHAAIAATIARAAQAPSVQAAQEIIQQGKVGFLNLHKYAGAYQMAALQRRIGQSRRVIYQEAGDYAPGAMELYRGGGLPEGYFVRNQPSRIAGKDWATTAFPWSAVGPGLLRDVGTGFVSSVPLEKLGKRTQLGVQQTLLRPSYYSGEAQKKLVKGPWSGETGELAWAFVSTSEMAGPGGGLIHPELLAGRTRIVQYPFKARGEVQWTRLNVRGQPGQPLTVGEEIVAGERRPIQIPAAHFPVGSTPVLRNIGRFDPHDPNSYVLEVESYLPVESGRAKLAGAGFKAHLGVGEPEHFAYWGEHLYTQGKGGTLEQRPGPVQMLLPPWKISQQGLLHVADAIVKGNPELAAQLGIGETPTPESLVAVQQWIDQQQRRWLFGYEQVHEKELEVFQAKAAHQAARRFAGQLPVSPVPQPVAGRPGFFDVPMLWEGVYVPFLYQLKEEYPTRSQQMSLEQLTKIAEADPRLLPIVERWLRRGGTPASRVYAAALHNLELEGAQLRPVQELDPIKLRLMVGQAGEMVAPTGAETLRSWGSSLEKLGLAARQPFRLNLGAFMAPGWLSSRQRLSAELGVPIGEQFVMPDVRSMLGFVTAPKAGIESSAFVTRYLKTIQSLAAADTEESTEDALRQLLQFKQTWEEFLQSPKVRAAAMGARVRRAGAPAVYSSLLAPNQMGLGPGAVATMYGLGPEQLAELDLAQESLSAGEVGVIGLREPHVSRDVALMHGVSEEEVMRHVRPGTVTPARWGHGIAVSEAAQLIWRGDVDSDLIYATLAAARTKLPVTETGTLGRWRYQQRIKPSGASDILAQALAIQAREDPQSLQGLTGTPAMMLARAGSQEYSKYFQSEWQPKPLLAGPSPEYPVSGTQLNEIFLQQALGQIAKGQAYWPIRQHSLFEQMATRIADPEARAAWLSRIKGLAGPLYQPALDDLLQDPTYRRLLAVLSSKAVQSGNILSPYEERRGEFPGLAAAPTGGKGFSPRAAQSYLVHLLTKSVATEAPGQLPVPGVAAGLTMDPARMAQVETILNQVREQKLGSLRGAAEIQGVLGEEYATSAQAGPLLLPVSVSAAARGVALPPMLQRQTQVSEALRQVLGKTPLSPVQLLELVGQIPRLGTLGRLSDVALERLGIRTTRRTRMHSGGVVGDWLSQLQTSWLQSEQNRRSGKGKTWEIAAEEDLSPDEVLVVAQRGEVIVPERIAQKVNEMFAGKTPPAADDPRYSDVKQWWQNFVAAQPGSKPAATVSPPPSLPATPAATTVSPPPSLPATPAATTAASEESLDLTMTMSAWSSERAEANAQAWARRHAEAAAAELLRLESIMTAASSTGMNVYFGRGGHTWASPPPRERGIGMLGNMLERFAAGNWELTQEQYRGLRGLMGSTKAQAVRFFQQGMSQRGDPRAMVRMLQAAEKLQDLTWGAEPAAQYLTGAGSEPGLLAKMRERVSTLYPGVDAEALTTLAQEDPKRALGQLVYGQLFQLGRVRSPEEAEQEIQRLTAMGITAPATYVENVQKFFTGISGEVTPANQAAMTALWTAKRGIVGGGFAIPIPLEQRADWRLRQARILQERRWQREQLRVAQTERTEAGLAQTGAAIQKTQWGTLGPTEVEQFYQNYGAAVGQVGRINDLESMLLGAQSGATVGQIKTARHAGARAMMALQAGGQWTPEAQTGMQQFFEQLNRNTEALKKNTEQQEEGLATQRQITEAQRAFQQVMAPYLARAPAAQVQYAEVRQRALEGVGVIQTGGRPTAQQFAAMQAMGRQPALRGGLTEQQQVNLGEALAQEQVMQELTGPPPRRQQRGFGIAGNIMSELSIGGTAFALRLIGSLLTGPQQGWRETYFQQAAGLQQGALLGGAVVSGAGGGYLDYLQAQTAIQVARARLGAGVNQVLTPWAVAGGTEGLGAAATIGGYGLFGGLAVGKIGMAIAGMLPPGGAAAALVGTAAPWVGLGVGLITAGTLAAGYAGQVAKTGWYKTEANTWSRTWQQAVRAVQLRQEYPLAKYSGASGGIFDAEMQALLAARELKIQERLQAELAAYSPGNLGYDIDKIKAYLAANPKLAAVAPDVMAGIMGQLTQMGGVTSQQIYTGTVPKAQAILEQLAPMAQAGVNASEILRPVTEVMAYANVPYGKGALQFINQFMQQVPREQWGVYTQAAQALNPLSTLRGRELTIEEIGRYTAQIQQYGMEKVRTATVVAEQVYIQTGRPMDAITLLAQYGNLAPTQIQQAAQMEAGVGGLAAAFGFPYGGAAARQFEMPFATMLPAQVQQLQTYGSLISTTLQQYGWQPANVAAAAAMMQRQNLSTGQVQQWLQTTLGTAGLGYAAGTPMGRYMTGLAQATGATMGLQGPAAGATGEQVLQDLLRDVMPYMKKSDWENLFERRGRITTEGWQTTLEPKQWLAVLVKAVTEGQQSAFEAATIVKASQGLLGLAGYGGYAAQTPEAIAYEQAINLGHLLGPAALNRQLTYGASLAQSLGRYGVGVPSQTMRGIGWGNSALGGGGGITTTLADLLNQFLPTQQGYAMRQLVAAGQPLNAFSGQGWQYGGYEYSPLYGLQQLGFARQLEFREQYGRLQHAYNVGSAGGAWRPGGWSQTAYTVTPGTGGLPGTVNWVEPGTPGAMPATTFGGGRFEGGVPYGIAGELRLHEDFMALTKELRQINEAQRAVSRGYQMQQVGFQIEHAQLQYRQALESLGLSETIFRAQKGYQFQELAVQQQQFATRLGWQREDFAYQQAMAGLQYGWGQEDLERSIRFATGRERQQLIRQRERQQILYGMQTGQMGRERERAETQATWQQEAFERQRQQLQEVTALQEEQFVLQRRHLKENFELQMRQLQAQMGYLKTMWGLEDEERKKQYDYQDKQQQVQKVQLEHQLVMAKMQQANFEAEIAEQKKIAEEVKKYTDELYGAFKGPDGRIYASALSFITAWEKALKAALPTGGAAKPVGSGGTGTTTIPPGPVEGGPTLPPTWTCPVCGEVFYSEAAYLAHRRTHTPSGPTPLATAVWAETAQLRHDKTTQPVPLQIQVYLGDKDITELVAVQVVQSPAFERGLNSLAYRQRNVVM